jgi:hypothetical protein
MPGQIGQYSAVTYFLGSNNKTTVTTATVAAGMIILVCKTYYRVSRIDG